MSILQKPDDIRILQKLDQFRIPFEGIKQATNNFGPENVIGLGGYGMVYMGELVHSRTRIKIAAKRVDRRFNHGVTHFLNEIKVLSSYKHVNIVSFIGFCDEHDEKILVEKFVAYGSLDNYLSSAKLNWMNRIQICLGAAHGLNYLHNGLEGHTVLHRDIRSRTILLDTNWQPKIGGLGLSMMDPMLQIISDGFGANGYVDPMFLKTGIITKESDVYSFGVVLFEVLCGRLVYETSEDEKQFLGPLAHQLYEEGKLNEIIDPILREQMNPDSLETFSAIAYQCVEKSRWQRPSMIQIVQKLEQVLRLQQGFENALALQQVAQSLKGKQEDEDCYKVKNLEHMKIPLEQIKLATRDFHDDFLIGRGGYGKVYKADLFHFDVQKYIKENVYREVSMIELSGFERRKSTVAIKRLDRRYGQGTAEFLQEISVLPYFKHQNLVKLVGFCDEGHERILISEYASNGSLDKYVCKNNHTWAQRLQICLDAAHGLEFLHNGVGEYHRIIHRDIKSSNILLDRNWVGKISDFGLSRIGPANLQATFVMTQVAGTLEYVDPQYHKTGMLTKGSDVYSFGVVLVEILSGRLAYFPRSKDDPEFLPYMAKRCFEENKIIEILDPKLKKEFEKGSSSTFDDEICPDSVIIFAIIAYKCLQENRDDRPAMPEVVEELEKALKSHVKGVERLRTSLDAIRFATNDFSDVMEQGVHHTEYRGELSHSKGHHDVIVKRLNPIVTSNGNKFYKEITMLYSYSHKNIIPLLGFCEEAHERIVVFEHMVNGSLKRHVKNTSLTWKQRLKICIDVAHGLAHIHSGADTQYSVHGDIKSSIILLNHDWKAVISDFIIPKGVGTLGYYDPLYATTGNLTQKSDVYSFGVVLFEILSGRLAIETQNIDEKQSIHGGEDDRVIFLSQLAVQCFQNNQLEDIIFHDMKGKIDAKSLVVFSTIAYQCLQERLEERPTMAEVVKELEKAFVCQDEWEWEQKLPRDYEKIIHVSNYPISNLSSKKDLHSLLSSGILIPKEKLWFSISMNGVNNVVISATKFSYKNVKWRSIRKSRFAKVAKIPDLSNLNIQINIKTQFLTPGVMYRAYLVFKFCDRRKVSSRPLYVNLKYKKSDETLNAYFAEWKTGSNWLTIELFRFWNNDKESAIEFDVLLESFSRYYCGSGGIFVEGIEFQAIHHVDANSNEELNNERNIGPLKPMSNMDLVEQMTIDHCQEIINRSEIENNIRSSSKEELHNLLFKGILIDKGEKIFSLSKENWKKCHMLPAKAVIYDHSDVKSYKIKLQSQLRCRFGEYVEILSRHELRIKCDIETQMLSSDTAYACFLMFKLSENCGGLKCPVKARDLLPYKKERTKIISFRSPNIVDLDKIKWIPKQREDGWMEVIVWETISSDDSGSISMDLKLISFEGTMSGLMVCGIEFRPI
ncbi:uncharacterized protein LOC111882949 isoform X1 [Lactuca sativa]|uniref:Protein kinase domain-containing protein n=1 Tax=Lactuca sativa TaxID=4236 RepID=A0A9R1V646_LACSA|nr:uncharacterized protein LOC111882949 isoform X1 [Lactuca sativa]KAJ0199212.1 hypothetical protein LSAT_V11C600305610 [Lactuca sativa]